MLVFALLISHTNVEITFDDHQKKEIKEIKHIRDKFWYSRQITVL